MINRKWQVWRIAAWQFAAYLALACTFPACESAEPERAMVEVKFRVVEVSSTKLRACGFDWHAISGNEMLHDGVKFGKFLDALAENNLAQTVAKPMIAAEDGRPASLKVATRTLEVTPTVLDNDRIRLAYRIATEIPARQGSAPRAAMPFESASTTELTSGEAQVLSETRLLNYGADGKKHETTIYVVAEARVVMP